MQPNRDVGPDCGEQDWECIDKWAHENPDKLPCALEGDDECWGKWLVENPPCEDDACWESFVEYFGEEGDGKGKDRMPCKDQDWDCWDKFAAENPDKLPCALEDDDECWWQWIEKNPPCKDDDFGCWESWADHYFGEDKKDGQKERPQPEGPDCDYADWDCVDNWAMNNQEKLPCALEDDDECWLGFLAKNPPCKEDDDACWGSFLEHYFPQEENEEMCAEVVAPGCGDQDWTCQEDWVVDIAVNAPEELPCGLEGDDLCWVDAFLTCPPCKWDDGDCWESFEDYAEPKVEEYYCADDDWACWDQFKADHPDLMPCEDEDLACWLDFLEENPPCDEEDLECWATFMEHYFPQEAHADECAAAIPCERGDWECVDGVFMDALVND